MNKNIYDYVGNTYIKNLQKSELCIFNNNCIKIRNINTETIEVQRGLVILKNHKNAFINKLNSDVDKDESEEIADKKK